jgi:hypothetical protein
MKTYILNLEPHDDLNSARDKMGWGKNSRILLVWPEKGQLLNRRLDLLLLLRHSQSLGSQLALVSRDLDVRYFAPRLGIPVYKNLNRAQNQHWRVPRRFRKGQQEESDISGSVGIKRQKEAVVRTPPSKPQSDIPRLNPVARLAVFTIGVLSVLAIAATLVPSARLSLTPQIMVQDVLIDAWTDPSLDQVSLSGSVPHQLVSVIVEGRDSLPSSASVTLPIKSAEGEIIFTNLTDQPVQIPAGTVVSTSRTPFVRFSTLRDGVVPAGSGQQITLAARCLKAGSQGNLPSGALIAIEGLLGTQLSATNPEPTHGGADRQEPVPSLSDRRELADRLRASLEKTAREEIESQLSPGDLFIPSSLRLKETLEETFQPSDDSPADHLDLSQRLEYEAWVVKASDIQKLAQAVFDANLPTGFLPLTDTLQIDILSPPEPDGKELTRWRMHAVRQMQAKINESQAVKLSLGLPAARAAEALKSALPLEEPPHIELQPSWWPRLPILPFRIEVVGLKAGSSGEEDGL